MPKLSNHGSVIPALLISVALPACGDPPTSHEARGTSAAGSRSSAFEGGRPEEKAFADLAMRSPSSAGFFLDSLGRAVVIVRDTIDDASARLALNDLAASGRVSGSPAAIQNARIQRGQFTYQQLSTWRNIAFERILWLEGVSSLDLDERANRVTIGLTPQSASSLRRSLPAQLIAAGIDTSAVRYRVHEPVRASIGRFPLGETVPRTRLTFAAGSLSAQWDTLVGGIWVRTTPGFCSLGIVADLGS